MVELDKKLGEEKLSDGFVEKLKDTKQELDSLAKDMSEGLKEKERKKRFHKGEKLEDQHLEHLVERVCHLASKDIQAFDWDRIDRNLSYDEQKEQVIQQLKDSGILTKEIELELGLSSPKDVEEEKGRFEQQMNELEEKQTLEQFQNSIQEIQQKTSIEIDKYFADVKKYVEMPAKEYANASILISEGGMGKTFQVLNTLGDLGYEMVMPNSEIVSDDKKKFLYVSTFSSPLELYNIFYFAKSRNIKGIVLDDCEGILTDEKSIGILKSASWSASGKRFISYYSTTDKLDAPKLFEWDGWVIICLNEIGNNKQLESLVSRCMSYELKFDWKTKIEIFLEISKKNYKDTTTKERFEIVGFLKEHTDESTRNLNLRTLVKLFDIYRFDKNNWKETAVKMLEIDEEKYLVKELNKGICPECDESLKSVEDQARHFTRHCGASRREFFRTRKELGIRLICREKNK